MRAVKILQAVSSYFDVSLEDLKSKSRKREISYPRLVYFNLCIHYDECKEDPLRHDLIVCTRLVNRHHATIYNGWRRINGFMETDVSVLRDVKALKLILSFKAVCKPCTEIYVSL